MNFKTTTMYHVMYHHEGLEEETTKEQIDCSMCRFYWVGCPVWCILIIIGIVFIGLRLNGHSIVKPEPSWTCYCSPNKIVVTNQTDVFCCPSYSVSFLCDKAVFGSPETPFINSACNTILPITILNFAVWIVATGYITFAYITANKCRYWYIDVSSILYFLVILTLFGLSIYAETRKHELDSDSCNDLRRNHS